VLSLCVIILTMLFLSTVIHKITKFRQHVKGVTNLLPSRFRRFGATCGVASVVSEISILLLILCGFLRYAAILVIFILSVYSLATGLRTSGSNHESCGCGGLVGDHRLGKALWVRDLALALPSFLLLSVPKREAIWMVFHQIPGQFVVISTLTALGYLVSINLFASIYDFSYKNL